ncbi:MAG: plasmid pRiA4b ORF-3 family protein, partial [Candidatus Eisenbacteria bacterium]
MPSSITLEKLHVVLQVSLGWTDSHLHKFVAGGRDYGVPNPDFDFGDSMYDEHGVPLCQLLEKEKDWVRYDYDFGDGWEHRVELEKVLPFDPDIALPRCIKGRRACPPEDVGGTWGYED